MALSDPLRGTGPRPGDTSKLGHAVRSLKHAFVGVGLFSAAINILMLTGPLFMLQVYDRVLTSGSVPTLIALFLLVAGLFGFLGLFDFIRMRVLSRIGYRLDAKLMGASFRSWIFQGLSGGQNGGSGQKNRSRPMSDLATIRQFMGGPGLPALFDLPWTPVYLAIVYFLHFYLGLLATVGALIVILLAVINNFSTKKPLAEAGAADALETRFSEKGFRNADSIISMGMTGNVVTYWEDMRLAGMSNSQKAGERSERFTSASKAIRMLLQSAILGLGAYLVLQQEITPGSIIAASIIAGRALAPIDQTIGNWRNVIRARLCYARLNRALSSSQKTTSLLELPAPTGHVVVSGVSKLVPSMNGDVSGTLVPILQGIDFTLQPGDGLGIIGPTASGKSSLGRLLAGLWMPDRGSVRLDGATYDQWDSDQLGRYVGYLSQSVEMMGGTIQQNIARFDPAARDEEVVEAAKLAGVHDMILRLPDGYATQIGNDTTPLSGGQAQRIALARAVFRKPALVILDEPNSNLDATGDQALTNAILSLRSAGSTVVVMAHRPSAIDAVNNILMLQNGIQVEFGPKAEVLQKVTRNSTG